MKRYILLAAAALVSCMGFISCDDEFLDKTPTTKYTVENAFNSYDNFMAYIYGNLYPAFTGTNASTTPTGPKMSAASVDVSAYSCFSIYNNNVSFIGTMPEVTRPNAFHLDAACAWWTNPYQGVRQTNVALERIDRTSGALTEKEADNIEAQCLFFRAWFHYDVLANLGDAIYYSDHEIPVSEVASIESDGRIKAFDKLHADLTRALSLIDDSFAPANTINSTVIKSFLARVDLFEGSWRKYHNVQEVGDYFTGQAALQECVKLCQEIATGRSLYTGNGTEMIKGQGWGQLHSLEDASTVPEVFMYAQFKHGLKGSGIANECHGIVGKCLPQQVINLYLTEEGLPIHNPKAKHYEYCGAPNGTPVYEECDAYDYANCDPYKTMRKRDPRLIQTVIPPYYVEKTGDNSYRVDESCNGMYAEYLHQFHRSGSYDAATGTYTIPDMQDKNGKSFGINHNYALPSHTSDGKVGFCIPNLAMHANVAPQTTGGNIPLRSDSNAGLSTSGYSLWVGNGEWDYLKKDQGDIDAPLFWLAETLLDWAEASAILGQFNQSVADKTINLLRDRAGVGRMDVSQIDANFDPDRAKAAWSKDIDPVMFEIRRERIVELMGCTGILEDVRRWHMGEWANQPFSGIWVDADNVNRSCMVSKSGGETGLYNPATDKEYSKADVAAAGGAHLYIHMDPLKNGGGWPEKFYTWAMGLAELNAVPGLKQCPGWEE